MAPTGFVPALWVAFPARLDMPGHPQDGCDLVPGETVVDIPAGEADQSGHWQPLPSDEKPLTELKKAELQDRAEALGLPKTGTVAELIAAIEAATKEPQPEPPLEIPEGVVPGETPGWPVDAETGEPLRLTDEQRAELAQAELEQGGDV